MSSLNDLERLLDRIEPVGPPAELKSRSLGAARAVMSRPVPRRDLWTRLWESHSVRLAWASATVALVLGHVALSLPARGSDQAPRPPVVWARSAPDAELAELADLPRLRGDRLPTLDAPFNVRPDAPTVSTTERNGHHDV